MRVVGERMIARIRFMVAFPFVALGFVSCLFGMLLGGESMRVVTGGFIAKIDEVT